MTAKDTGQQKGRKKYTPAEKKVLLDLVERHAAVLDRLETDSASLERKNRAWLIIQREFNAVDTHTRRTVKQLRKALDNHKTKQKLLKKYKEKMPDYQNYNLKSEDESDFGELSIVEDVEEFERNVDNDLDNLLGKNSRPTMMEEENFSEESISITDVAEVLPDGRSKRRYTHAERAFFISLVKKYAEVLESHEVDSQSLQRKMKTWRLVQREFNSVDSHTPRTVKQLRKAWDNHKTKQKALMNRNQNWPDSAAAAGGGVLTVLEVEDNRGVDTGNVLDVVGGGDQRSPNDLGTAEDNESGKEIIPDSPNGRPTKLSKQLHLRSRLAEDAEVLSLLKKEMLINLETAEVEKRRAEVELRHKQEELDHKRRMWELEIQILEKKLKE